jgi:hypothetical protein
MDNDKIIPTGTNLAESSLLEIESQIKANKAKTEAKRQAWVRLTGKINPDQNQIKR